MPFRSHPNQPAHWVRTPVPQPPSDFLFFPASSSRFLNVHFIYSKNTTLRVLLGESFTCVHLCCCHPEQDTEHFQHSRRLPIPHPSKSALKGTHHSDLSYPRLVIQIKLRISGILQNILFVSDISLHLRSGGVTH